MPQFDLFIWFTLSFSTILVFQLLFLLLKYYIIAPFSNLQKTLIKLHVRASKQTSTIRAVSILETFVQIFFEKAQRGTN